ncbi:MAG: hypothetical protein WC884_04030 [Candidatus Paceibacterota bacterium]
MHLLLSLLYNNDLPALAQNIGMAGLTILIPVAIAIFSLDKDFKELDNHLVLDHIIQASSLPIYIGLIFVPFLFWENSSIFLRFTELVLWGVGTFFLIQILSLSYNWLKGNKFPLRFDFLKKITDKKDIEESWNSVWVNEKINGSNENDFFEIYSIKLEELFNKIETPDLKISLKIIGDFKKNINIRSTFFLSYNALPKILEWHVQIWKKDLLLLKDGAKKLDKWSYYYQILNQLDGIIVDIEKRLLTENTMGIFNLFDSLNKHTKKYTETKVIIKIDDERYYIEHLMNIFYKDFFDLFDGSPSRYQIWEKTCFPDEWKIKSNTLVTDIFQRITLNNFLRWASDRISNPSNKEFDRALDQASMELFPEVDPIWWATILIITISPYDPDSKMKYIIEKPWTFGFIGRLKSFSGSYNDNSDNEANQMKIIDEMNRIEEEKTLEMVESMTKVFSKFAYTFKEENILRYIKQLNLLENTYNKDSKEEHRRNKILLILNNFLKRIKNV